MAAMFECQVMIEKNKTLSTQSPIGSCLPASRTPLGVMQFFFSELFIALEKPFPPCGFEPGEGDFVRMALFRFLLNKVQQFFEGRLFFRLAICDQN